MITVQNSSIRWMAQIFTFYMLLTSSVHLAAEPNEAVNLVDLMWAQYRQPITEREEFDILIIPSPKNYYSPDDARMLIKALPQGITHKRMVRNVLYADNGHDKIHVKFSKPKEDAGTSMLIWRHPMDGKDRQWLYVPVLGKVRRIPLSIIQGFAGTGLSYEDMRHLVGEKTARSRYELLADQACSGRTCRVVLTRPKGVSAYSSRKIWIDSEKNYLSKIEYFDKAGVLWKTLRAIDMYEASEGVFRAQMLEMHDLQLNESTLLLASKRRLGEKAPGTIFTLDYFESS